MAAPDTREQLVRAARDLLVEEGVSALSLRRVAAACGVSAAAIYRHFADKDALVSAAAAQGFRVFGEYLQDALSGRSARARLERILQRYLDFAREHPRDYQLMFMTPCKELGRPVLDAEGARLAGGTFQMLVDRITECQHAGELRREDPRALSVFAWSALHGLASLTLTGNLGAQGAELQALEVLQLEAIMRALIADEGRNARQRARISQGSS